MGRKFNSRRKMRKKSIFIRKWFLALILLGVCALFTMFFLYRMVTDPYRERAQGYAMNLVSVTQLPSVIYDREEREIGRLFVENRSPISIEEMPQMMIDALISGEDSRFFDHDGVDYVGIARAALLNLKSGAEDSGASTLTMQLARNAYDLKQEALSRDESSYERKLVEIYLAQRIEKYYTKSKILEFYLNRVAFGSGYYGIRSASLGYFGKEPKDLEVQECASLVGCIKNPSIFSPLRSKKNNKKARDHVLKRMAIEGIISWRESDRLREQPVQLNPKPIQRNTSHIYDRVAATVREHVDTEDLAKGDFRIFTSIDKDIQNSLEKNLQHQLAEVEERAGYTHAKYQDYKKGEKSRPKYLQGAAFMMNHKTGEVLAYVGGRDFGDSQYDFITSGRKPLGTAFFPFVYAAALEAGSHLSVRLLDEAMDNRLVMIDGVEGILGEWGAEIASPRYEGSISLREGLEKSKIAATVRLGKKIGLDKVRKVIERLGFKVPRGEPLTRELLGVESASLLEVVRAYSAFANQGKVMDKMVWVTRIERGDGSVVYDANLGKKGPEMHAVLHPATAYLVHSMLEGSLFRGSGARGLKGDALEGFSGGGKSGTTSDFADNWFVGYNSEVTCAVWSGFWSGSREAIYPGAFSVDTVMPVWVDAMQLYEQKYEPEMVQRPEGVESVTICSLSGLRATMDCEDYRRNPQTGKMETYTTAVEEWYYVHNKPLGYCDVHGSRLSGVDASAFSLTNRVGAKNYSNITPVKPVAPTLLGNDPYNTETPTFIPSDTVKIDTSRGLEAINPDVLVEQDALSTIVTPRPYKIQIVVD